MAKKKRKKSAGPPDVDPNQRRRERLEARRQAKAEALAARRRRERRERLIRLGMFALLGALLVWFFFFRGQTPDAIAGHPIEKFSFRGAGEHTGPFEYESRPPVSGAHDPSAAPCGVHSAQIPDAAQVHTLEHGAVGIQYRPNLDPEEIERIEAIVGDYDTHVFSAPYAGMETPIAVTAWGHLMELDSVDEEAIREFIEAFRRGGRAPEANQECPNTQDSPFEPQEERSPSPAPSPTRRNRNRGGDGDN